MATKEIRDELVSKLIGGVWSYADLTHNREVIDQALTAAVAEERERCAKVAETCGSADQPTMEGRPVIPSVRRHGAEIAVAIRKEGA